MYILLFFMSSFLLSTVISTLSQSSSETELKGTSSLTSSPNISLSW